jgi:dihydroflavonol-4-reductase
MAKTLLTGATGFLGAHLARELAGRGDDLRITVRADSDTRAIDDLDVERVRCDILDKRSVRRALKGVDRVFHAAGLTSMRPQDSERLFEVNAGGTRTVLGECLEAGVERVIYTSSAAALGPAEPGGAADERQLFTAGHLGIPYVNSVHEAEGEAFRLAARGLPLVCVNPTVAFGPGDVHVTSTRLVRSFLLGHVPAYADGALNVVDVRDVATGHLLADAHGGLGERYILGGRNFTFDRLFADLSRLSGVERPVKLPATVAIAVARALEAASAASSRRSRSRAGSRWRRRACWASARRR